jgi:Right handed beta helix region
MFRTTFILFGFTFGLLSIHCQATTYYLDPASGNDFHSGVQASSAWKALQYASSKVYHPGDRILLKAGGVWTGETLDVTTADELGNPITIGSYGTGKQPIIDGANTSATTPITLRNAHNVIIDGLTIQNAGSSLITVVGGSNNTVKNCTLLNGSIFPVQVKGSPGFTFANNTYTSTGSFRTIAAVFLAQGSPSTGLTVTGNTITLNSASNGAKAIYVCDTNNAVISGNTVIGGSQGIGIKAYHGSVTGAKLYDNSIYYTDNTAGDGESIEFTGKPGTSYRASGSVYHNFIKGGPNTHTAIGGFQANNVAVYNNIVIGPVQNAIHWSSTSSGGLFYGNTIHNVRVAFAVFSGSSATIRNNIISKAEVGSSVSGASVTEDYNIFYASGARGVARGAHSTTADPKFVNPTPAGPLDFKLQSGSPAIHSGSTLTSTYKDALNPSSAVFPCLMLDQTLYGWNRGAFGSQ